MTKKRKLQSDQQPESSTVAVIKSLEISESSDPVDSDASTSKLDSCRGYAYAIRDEPRKLKFLRRRRLMDSVDTNDKSGYVTNLFTSIADNPSLHTLPADYPTARSLIGYIYHGEKEVDRLDRFFGYSKRTEYEIKNQVQNHKQVYDDLLEAQRMFNNLACSNAGLEEMGMIADKIGWRQMPSVLMKRLHEDSINQAFETDQMTNAEIKSLIRHETLDWFDDYDIDSVPAQSILDDIENPRYGTADPPITCCIFTKHRNGQISRCLREPVKAFHLQLCAKVVKKDFPFCWDKKVKTPAICAFHTSIIEKEPKNTEFNLFFERALGKHERIEPVKFNDKLQYSQLGKFIDRTLQQEKEEYANAMSFDLQLLKLLEPPRTGQQLQEIRGRQLFDSGVARNGKSEEELDDYYEKTVRRRNELRTTPKCPYKVDLSEDEVDQMELPSSGEEWLLKLPDETGPSPPLFNSFIDDGDMNDDERVLYKASEFGLLDMNEPLVEAAERYKALLDVQAFDDDTLRVFGAKSNGIEGPRLNFDAISAASVRRVKKFYNLPNRSGATSKPLLLEGLNDYFLNKPIDEFEVAQEFIKNITERQKKKNDSKGQGLLYDKIRKPRQTKKSVFSSDLKYDAAAESSTTSEMPLNNLTVMNVISTSEQDAVKNYSTK